MMQTSEKEKKLAEFNFMQAFIENNFDFIAEEQKSSEVTKKYFTAGEMIGEIFYSNKYQISNRLVIASKEKGFCIFFDRSENPETSQEIEITSHYTLEKLVA